MEEAKVGMIIPISSPTEEEVNQLRVEIKELKKEVKELKDKLSKFFGGDSWKE